MDTADWAAPESNQIPTEKAQTGLESAQRTLVPIFVINRSPVQIRPPAPHLRQGFLTEIFLYDWAGQVHTVNISKEGTSFRLAEDIELCTARIFDHLNEQNYFRRPSHDVFTDEIVDFYCATNDLPPFRRGSGRTQRAFLT